MRADAASMIMVASISLSDRRHKGAFHDHSHQDVANPGRPSHTGCVALGVAFAAAPAVSSAAAASAAHEPRPMEIAAARALPVNTVVTVEGSVTVPSGLLSSGGSLDQGFAIQDRTGGIYVGVATNLGLNLRQRVLVTGKLANSNGFLILVPATTGDVEVRGREPRVKPLWLRTASVGAANQGQLVQVVGVSTQPVAPDPPFGNWRSPWRSRCSRGRSLCRWRCGLVPQECHQALG